MIFTGDDREKKCDQREEGHGRGYNEDTQVCRDREMQAERGNGRIVFG